MNSPVPAFRLFVVVVLAGLLPMAPAGAQSTLPVVTFLSPSVPYQAIEGPEFKLRVRIVGSGAAINEASLRVTLDGADITGRLQWNPERTEVSATLVEPVDLQTGLRSVDVDVRDTAGNQTTKRAEFFFTIPNAVQAMLDVRGVQRQNVFGTTGHTFDSAQRGLVQIAGTKFANPDTGRGYQSAADVLRRAGLNRDTWLPLDAPFARKVDELIIAANELVWLPLPLARGIDVANLEGLVERQSQNYTFEVINTVAPLDGPPLLANALAFLPLRGDDVRIQTDQNSPYLGGRLYSSTFGRLRILPSWYLRATAQRLMSALRLSPVPTVTLPYRPTAAKLVVREMGALRKWPLKPCCDSTPVVATIGAGRSATWPPGPSTPYLPPVATMTFMPYIDEFGRHFYRPPAQTVFDLDLSLLVPDPASDPIRFGDAPLVLDVRFDTPPIQSPPIGSSCNGCLEGDDRYEFNSTVIVLYRAALPFVEPDRTAPYRCGVSPLLSNPKVVVDNDHDGLLSSQEATGVLSRIRGVGQARTNPDNCDSIGNGLKDGEAHKWEQPRDVMRPLFMRPGGEEVSFDTIEINRRYGGSGPAAERLVPRPGVIPVQSWQRNSAAFPNSGRGTFQIVGKLFAPPIAPDAIGTSRPLGHVEIGLSSLDLNFQTGRATNSPFVPGEMYLTVKPVLNERIEGNLVQGWVDFSDPNFEIDDGPYFIRSLETTADVTVLFDFINASTGRGFNVTEFDTPAAPMEVRDFGGGIPDAIEQKNLSYTLEELGVDLPLGFSLKTDFNGGWEVGTPIAELKVVPGNDTPVIGSPRLHAPKAFYPQGINPVETGPVLSQTLRLPGSKGSPAGPALLTYQANLLAEGIAAFAGSPNRGRSEWSLPIRLDATNVSANARDVLRIRISGQVNWFGELGARKSRRDSLVDSGISVETEYHAANIFNHTYYLMLRREDWCVSDGAIGCTNPVAPQVAKESATPAAANVMHPPAPAVAMAHLAGELPTISFASSSITSTLGPGATMPDMIRATWALSSPVASPQTAYVALEAFPTGAPPVASLVGPITVGSSPVTGTVDLPAPISGTYQTTLRLYDGSLDLQGGVFAILGISASAPVSPAVTLTGASNASAGLIPSVTWTASNPTAMSKTVSLVGILRDATGAVRDVVAVNPPALGPGSGGGTIAFSPVISAGHYLAEILLRDSANRVLGSRAVPLPLGMPGSTLTGVYGDLLAGQSQGITITAGVSAGTAGLYQVSGELVSLDGLMIDQGHGQAMLPVGTGTVALVFDGREIGRSGKAGPYRLRNVALKSASAVVDLASQPYTTTVPYPLGTFTVPTAFLAGTFADFGSRPAPDGKYAELAVDIGVTTTVPSTYTVQARLSDAAGGFIATGTGSRVVPTGGGAVQVIFDGRTIAAANRNGPYVVGDIELIDRRGIVQQRSPLTFTTRSYLATDFTPHPVRLVGVAGHRLNRANPALGLTIDVSLVVTRAGQYEIEALISNAAGLQVWGTTTAYFSGGSQVVPLAFNLAGVPTSQAAGPSAIELIRVRLVDQSSTLDRRQNAYQISEPLIGPTTVYLPTVRRS